MIGIRELSLWFFAMGACGAPTLLGCSTRAASTGPGGGEGGSDQESDVSVGADAGDANPGDAGNPRDSGEAAAIDPCPPDAGALNVKDFGAVGDGVHDDTSAFLTAIDSSSVLQDWHAQLVCAPPGVYLVKNTLSKHYPDGGYNAGLVLVGAGPGVTTLRLADDAVGFQDPKNPKAVIFTTGDGTKQSPSGGYAALGEGDDAFSNFVENLTIDIGSTNLGAIGIDYLASNQGAIRNVVVTGSGAVGISMTRSWVGPALLKEVTVQGFGVGVDVGSDVFSVTMDTLTLIGQANIGLRNDSNLVSLHALQIDALGNAAEQAVVNTNSAGMIVMDSATVDARDKTGKTDGGTAFANDAGWLTLRNLDLVGYDTFLSKPLSASTAIDGIYQGSTYVSPSKPSWGGLSGPPAESPFMSTASAWVSVTSFGAVGDGVTDSTSAFTAAFASGAPAIDIPFGVYVLNGNIVVPSSVQHIAGMNSTLLVEPGTRSPSFSKTAGMLRTENTVSPLVIEKIVFSSTTGLQLAVEDLGSTPLLLRDIVGLGTSFQRDAAGGDLYLEDVSGGFVLNVAGAAPVWGAQIDSEGGGARGGSVTVRINNAGTPLYLLGAKSEGNNTLIANTNGAITDVLGAFTSPDGAGTVPMFSNVGSKLFVTGMELAFVPANNYATVLVDGADAGQTSILASTEPARPGTAGFFMPSVLGSH